MGVGVRSLVETSESSCMLVQSCNPSIRETRAEIVQHVQGHPGLAEFLSGAGVWEGGGKKETGKQRRAELRRGLNFKSLESCKAFKSNTDAETARSSGEFPSTT